MFLETNFTLLGSCNKQARVWVEVDRKQEQKQRMVMVDSVEGNDMD